jgi:hypothetical protein
LLIAAFVVAPSDWAVRHGGNIYLANVGYVTKLKNADCQVVIYGDSSAMVGLDPAVIRARTGLSACNIAEPAGMTMINEMMVPDLFLANNPKPKVWVFDFAADALAPYKTWDSVQTYEAIYLRLRLHKDLSTLKLLAEHPKQAFEFASLSLRLALFGVFKRPLPDSAYEVRSQNGGRYPSPDPPMTACGPEKFEHPSDPAYIAAIRARYGGDGAIVFVNSTPKPECDPSLDFYLKKHPAATDNKLEVYPMADFDNHGHSHMKESGVVKFSTSVGDQINDALKQQAH